MVRICRSGLSEGTVNRLVEAQRRHADLKGRSHQPLQARPRPGLKRRARAASERHCSAPIGPAASAEVIDAEQNVRSSLATDWRTRERGQPARRHGYRIIAPTRGFRVWTSGKLTTP